MYGKNVMAVYGNDIENLEKGIHDIGGQGPKSVASAGLVKCVDQLDRGKRRFAVSDLSEEFLELSALFTIVLVHWVRLRACQAADKTYLPRMATNFFAQSIKKLASRNHKCLNRFGDKVDK